MPIHTSLGPRQALVMCAVTALSTVLLSAVAGCGLCNNEGYADQSRTQLQFFAPPGATVTVKSLSNRTYDVPTYDPKDNRLERADHLYCIFNLSPGRYEFKYISADGMPDTSVYGELNIEHANSHMARVFQRRAFVPISLPSQHYQKVEVMGDEILPYRGEAFRTAIDEEDLERLKMGDVVEKVFFVADLEKAAKVRDKTIRDLRVCEREIEYAESRFRLAYQDFRIDVSDSSANFWGTDRRFISWEKKRQEMNTRYDKLQKKLRRINALLAGDQVLIREGMLALSTEEVCEPYRDVVEAADELGEVLLVMRLGGRHMQWGPVGDQLVNAEQ